MLVRKLNTKARKTKLVLAATLAVVASVAAVPAALAVTTYDATSGGFAGKGDIQTQWGWSDADLQNNFSRMAVNYKKNTKADVACTYFVPDQIAGNGKLIKASYTATKSQQAVANIKGDILYTARVKGSTPKVTGFSLAAPTGTEVVGALPTVGDACEPGPQGVDASYTPDDPSDAPVITAVDIIEEMEVITADYTGTQMTKTCTGAGKKQSCTTTTVDVILPTITLWKDGVSTVQPVTTTTTTTP